MPRVLNKLRDEIPADAVYVGRGSKWGNPYHIGEDGTRLEIIDRYRTWLEGRMDSLAELRGHDLVCFCSSPCHADVLLELANGEDA